MKPILVIYHKADFDGIFCREIARKFYCDKADYLGWDYGDPLPTVAPEVTRIVMLDISVDGMMDDHRLWWIDHHKSAIEKYGADLTGFRIDGVAACRLAWQWFFSDYGPLGIKGHQDPASVYLPTKEQFINREVSEPLAVRLAGEYDIWDRRDPDAELFQHGLRAQELDAWLWSEMLEDPRFPTDNELKEERQMLESGFGCGIKRREPEGTIYPMAVTRLLVAGKSIQYAKTEENKSIAKAAAFDLKFEGLNFCAINAARYNSHLFTAAVKPEHDGLFGFNYDGKQWRISLYGVPGKPDVDLSVIAVKYGGGGHKQACGFKLASLPFAK